MSIKAAKTFKDSQAKEREGEQKNDQYMQWYLSLNWGQTMCLAWNLSRQRVAKKERQERRGSVRREARIRARRRELKEARASVKRMKDKQAKTKDTRSGQIFCVLQAELIVSFAGFSDYQTVLLPSLSLCVVSSISFSQFWQRFSFWFFVFTLFNINQIQYATASKNKWHVHNT